MSTVATPQFEINFAPAKRIQSKARIALFGVSASGKTLAAMRIAIGLQNLIDASKGIAAIDSEHERINLYAEEEEFLDANGETRIRSYPLKAPYSPDHYIAAIEKAEGLGAQVLLIDSISHEWFGKGGIQQIVDEAAARQTGGNKWAGWSVGTPAHNSFVEALMSCDMHVVCTMRAKTEWMQVGGQPKKVGLGPVQREGMEYEFDAVIKLELPDHTGVVEVSRALRHFPPGTALTNEQTGSVFAERVWGWLSEGAPRDEAHKTEEARQRDEQQAAVEAQEQQEMAAQTPAEESTEQPPAEPASEEAAAGTAPAAEGADPAPVSEQPASDAAQPATEATAGENAEKLSSGKKGAVTKALKSLQDRHGDIDGGTDWTVRLSASLPNQKWNTRGVERVEDLTDEEADKLLATIAKTIEHYDEEKAQAAEDPQQTL